MKSLVALRTRPADSAPDVTDHLNDPLPQWGQGRGWFPYPEPLSGEIEWPNYGGAEWPFV